MALLRDGLFKKSSTMPRTYMRHASAHKRLSQSEKLIREVTSRVPSLPVIDSQAEKVVSKKQTEYRGGPGHITTEASRFVGYLQD